MMLYYVHTIVSALCFSTTVLAHVPPEYKPPHALETRAENKGCNQLKTKYPNLVSFPNTPTYTLENTNFYSGSAILSPGCVFTPRQTEDIAGALSIIRATKTSFGVRGGGHMPIAGAASTNHGVLIAMTNFNKNELGTFGGQQVAKIGSGQRWGDVYAWLEPYNLMVVGGRYAPVGVGGLLLGGGLSYFGSVRGWAVNHIVNYELVTADSKILQVNANSHPDLFWALKGGSSNYGIVTRFDLNTFHRSDVYAGFSTQDANNTDHLVQAIADFVDPVHGGILDDKTALDSNLFYSSDTGTITGLSSILYNDSVTTTPAAFVNFTNLPRTSSTIAPRTFSSWLNETLIYGKTPSRKLWAATSLKATPAAAKLCAQAFIAAVKNTRKFNKGTHTITWQPLSADLVKAARAQGGDAIDLDPKDGPILAMLLASDYADAVDDAYVSTFLKTLTADIDAKAKAAGLYYPFIFLNDAGGWQKTLSLYGQEKSFPRLQAVAKRYDPEEVFQRLDGGAFKVRDEGGK